MKKEDYLITTVVGEVARKFIWDGDAPVELDLPHGWTLEKSGEHFRLRDYSYANTEEQLKHSVTFAPPPEGRRTVIELPKAHAVQSREVGVDITCLKPVQPVYGHGAVAAGTQKTGPRQLCMYYGQRYFLVRYRPVSVANSEKLGLTSFHYMRSPQGFTVQSLSNDLEIKITGKKRRYGYGTHAYLTEAEFLSATFIVGIHWWRFRMVPTPDQLPPIETDESDEDVREKQQFRRTTTAVLGLFLAVSVTLGVYGFLNPHPKKIITAEVTLKTPKLIPPVAKKDPPPPPPPPKPEPIPEPPKVVKEPPPPPKKEVPKEVVKKVEPHKKIAKKESAPKHVAKKEPPAPAAAPAPPMPQVAKAPPVPDPASVKAAQLAAEKAAQQTQALKALSFLSTSGKKSVAVADNYKHEGAYSNVPTVGGDKSKSNVLDNIAKGAPGDGNIKTQSARTISSEVSFGNGKGKGLNEVQGKVSLNGLGGSHGEGLGNGGSLELSGPGQVSESEIEKALSKFLSRFQYCYEKALLSDGGLSGNLVVQWDIAGSGKATNAKVIKSQLRNEGLHGCVLGVLKEVPFPKALGGTATIKKTFSFTSSTL